MSKSRDIFENDRRINPRRDSGIKNRVIYNNRQKKKKKKITMVLCIMTEVKP